MRIADIGFAFPFLVLIICLVGLRGPGLSSLFFAVSLVGWIFYARLVRTEVRVLKDANYIRSARLSEFSTGRILLRHVLPNVMGQVMVYATSDFVYAVLLGASVSYLGLGAAAGARMGAMVAQGQNFITLQWWLAAFPGLAIVFLGLAFALIGDGLADMMRAGHWREPRPGRPQRHRALGASRGPLPGPARDQPGYRPRGDCRPGRRAGSGKTTLCRLVAGLLPERMGKLKARSCWPAGTSPPWEPAPCTGSGPAACPWSSSIRWPRSTR